MSKSSAAQAKPSQSTSLPKKLAKMRDNPQGDWHMRDIEQVANKLELQVTKPKRGSHYSVLSPYLAGALTVPKARPIKVTYIKQFVKLCEAHIEAREEAAEK